MRSFKKEYHTDSSTLPILILIIISMSLSFFVGLPLLERNPSTILAPLFKISHYNDIFVAQELHNPHTKWNDVLSEHQCTEVLDEFKASKSVQSPSLRKKDNTHHNLLQDNPYSRYYEDLLRNSVFPRLEKVSI